MNGIGKQAAFYCGYLPDERSLIPLTILLSTTVALWLLVYLASAVGHIPQNEGAAVTASACFVRDRQSRGLAEPSRRAWPTLSRSAVRWRKTEDASCSALTSQETPAPRTHSTCSAPAFDSSRRLRRIGHSIQGAV